MNKSELANRLTIRPPQLSHTAVGVVVTCFSEQIISTIVQDKKIAVSDFESFSLNYRTPKLDQNSKTDEPVIVAAKTKPHFKQEK